MPVSSVSNSRSSRPSPAATDSRAGCPDLDIKDWPIRTEREAAGSRNYEFVIGARRPFTHHVEVSSWSLMTHVRVDTPLGHALESLGIRKFRDLTFNTGVGYQRTAIKSSNRVAFGAHELRTGLRVNFHSVRFPGGIFDSRRTRYEL
jgi:hypothetical protein